MKIDSAVATRHKKKKNKIAVFVWILAFIAFGYIVYQIAALQIQIHDKNAEVTLLNNQIAEYQRINEDLENKIENHDLYLDQQAREQGYVDPGADVFKEAP